MQALRTDALRDFLLGIPAVFIGVTLNAMLSVPSGLAFFPDWLGTPPRSQGHGFQPAMGMMMVENILFMHTLAQTAYTVQGPGLDTVSTVMVLYALSTLTCGLF